VRARIAHVILGREQECARLGAITLKPHQQYAVTRAEGALEEFGGALLCDDVGLGKTFVATAIARRFPHSLVVAPAALASMWRDALATTNTTADFLTFERLSRAGSRPVTRGQHGLVIVDEAHHAKNPATRRYQNLAKLTRDARVLLLTATPIHNSTGELIALLSLFLGSRARALTPREVARCVVRREQSELADHVSMPMIVPALHRQVSDDPVVVRELMTLPSPLPVRGGGIAGALIGRGLVHQWASSEAALREAVRRRIAKAAALSISLESGRYPTATELKAWIYGDGALQLGFPELLSSPVDDAKSLLASVLAHADALREFSARHRSETALDAERADILAELRAEHPEARIIAFAQYAETVSMLFSRMSPSGAVAMLTARGGLVAGGRLTRDEILLRFAPRSLDAKASPPAERIDLLLTTDLLSEGVNLQDAGVVVHLDVPWTAARMEQRVGRVARMGSLHSRVHVYLLRPPASAAAVLRSERLVQRKWRMAKRTIGSTTNAPFEDEVIEEVGAGLKSVPALAEQLHAIIESWRRREPASDCVDTCVASVRAPKAGFVAAISVDGKPLLLASLSGFVSAELDAEIEACLLCGGDDVRADLEAYRTALDQINAWVEHDVARSAVGVGVADSRSHARHRLLNRIDSAIQNAPPHVRTARSVVAARARSIATNQHGAAIEAELGILANSGLPDHEFLDAVVGLASGEHSQHNVRDSIATLAIHAVILLRAAP
jgi:superfamily II DNA or RNA helicase